MFITFEGGEGSGKSAMSNRLCEFLNEHGVTVLHIAEPGGTPTGDKLTDILKNSLPEQITPLTELFLFNASRSQLVDTVIRPALYKGQVVVCDRYVDSTVAYQGYGRGLDLDMVWACCDMATGSLMPELTIFLDIPPSQGLKRKSQSDINRFEKEEQTFHQAVHSGFQKILQDEPWRFYAIDATLPANEVFNLIIDKISEYIDLSGIN